MLKNNIFSLYFFICFALLSGCYDVHVPAGYLPDPKEVESRITGSWISVKYHSQPNEIHTQKVNGELISFQADSFYVLTEKQLVAIEKNAIDTAILYIFKNQTGKYVLFTSLLLIPNILAAIGKDMPEFLILVAPWGFTGYINSIIEGYGHSNELIYPGKNSFEEFRKYARFPVGIPPEVEIDKLNLITFGKTTR